MIENAKTSTAALKQAIARDLYRYTGASGWRPFFALFVGTPGFRYTAIMRTTGWLKRRGRPFFLFYAGCRLWLKRLEYKFGISIPYNTAVRPGFYIGHYGGIVVNPKCIIGANCNLNHGVTIGETFGGKHPGVPHIGNSVYIGPHAIVIGGITIGDNVAIGAGSVVTRSVERNAVVAGNPAHMLSDKGSVNYIVNKIDEGIA